MNGCARCALAVEFLLGVPEPAALGDAWLVNRHLRLERRLRARKAATAIAIVSTSMKPISAT